MGQIGNMTVTASNSMPGNTDGANSASLWNNLNATQQQSSNVPLTQISSAHQKAAQQAALEQQRAAAKAANTPEARAAQMAQTQQATLNQIEMQNKIRAARMGQTYNPTPVPQAGASPQNSALQNQLMQLLKQFQGGGTPTQGSVNAHATTYKGNTPISGAGANQGMPNFVAPQINVSPIWNQGSVNQAQQGLNNTPVQSMPGGSSTQASGGALNQMMSDATRAGGMSAGLDFGRNAAFQNAEQVRSANQANVGRGLEAANLGASQYINQLGYNNAQQNLLLSMLGLLT